MDAYYYFYGGEQLVAGEGFSEMILWNYLDDPQGIPHPSHAYWMPLTSIVAALGIFLFGDFFTAYTSAKLMFVLVIACVPPLTASLTFAFTEKKDWAMFAGVLSAFMGYYQPFCTATDAFGLYMVLGGLFFLISIKGGQYKYFTLGLLAGFMHLSRADGILWLGVGLFALWFDSSLTNNTWRSSI